MPMYNAYKSYVLYAFREHGNDVKNLRGLNSIEWIIIFDFDVTKRDSIRTEVIKNNTLATTHPADRLVPSNSDSVTAIIR